MRMFLQTGCLLAGILCLFYYLGIVTYAGVSTSLSWLWILGGGFLILLSRVLVWRKRYPGTVLRIAEVGMLAAAVLALAVIVAVGSQVIRAMYAAPASGLDSVIVLGAQVRGTKPSNALRRRLDCALAYAEDNPDTVFVLSGGQGPDEEISEAECMYRYLTENPSGRAIAPARLKKEAASTSTKENLEFSAPLAGGKNARIGILSNDFHICRALMLAEKLGYTDVSGIPASSDPGMLPHNILREICCILAEKILS